MPGEADGYAASMSTNQSVLQRRFERSKTFDPLRARGSATREINAKDQSCLTQTFLYAPLNVFPFALKIHPRRFLHFSNNLGLFFSSSKADATVSALGIFRSVAT